MGCPEAPRAQPRPFRANIGSQSSVGAAGAEPALRALPSPVHPWTQHALLLAQPSPPAPHGRGHKLPTAGQHSCHPAVPPNARGVLGLSSPQDPRCLPGDERTGEEEGKVLSVTVALPPEEPWHPPLTPLRVPGEG